MGEAKRRREAFAHIEDDKWRDTLIRAHKVFEDAPLPLRTAWAHAFDPFLATAEEQQASPQQIAAVVATSLGFLCMVEVGGNPMNDSQVDEFIQLCHAAIHIGVASARIEAGWTPGGTH